MAATYTKFNQFIENVWGGVHDLFGTAGVSADTCNIYLTNATPSASTHAVKGDIAEITNEHGYSAPVSIANVTTRSGATITMNGTNVTVIASGGTVGPFRYVVLYDDTPTSPADPLIASWDYSAPLTLQSGETFTVRFNAGISNGTVMIAS